MTRCPPVLRAEFHGQSRRGDVRCPDAVRVDDELVPGVVPSHLSEHVRGHVGEAVVRPAQPQLDLPAKDWRVALANGEKKLAQGVYRMLECAESYV